MLSTESIAKQIRLVIFDVDGVLTNGHIYLGPTDEYVAFHCHDGLGMKLLEKSGVPIGIITSRRSEAVKRRLDYLGIEHVYLGQENKLAAYLDLLQKLNLTDAQVAYVGDDLVDLPLIKRAGLGIAVENALPLVKTHAKWVTEKPGGHGAVREICEYIMLTQGTFELALEKYFE